MPPARILAIGDSLRTDLKAAKGAGVEALFVAGGIHRHEVMTGSRIDPMQLAALFEAEPVPAVAAIAQLVW